MFINAVGFDEKTTYALNFFNHLHDAEFKDKMMGEAGNDLKQFNKEWIDDQYKKYKARKSESWAPDINYGTISLGTESPH